MFPATTKPLKNFALTTCLTRCAAIASTLIFGACAGVPPSRVGVFAHKNTLTTVVDQRHHHIEQFVDSDALRATPKISLPKVSLAKDAFVKPVSPALALLVANHAARSACLELSKYAEIQTESADGVYDISLVVTDIKPTSGATAGASSAIGFLLPIPSPRLPIGLGSLAIEAELRNAHGEQIALVRWARGANPVTHDAKISAVGDAWQLAGNFGKDFTQALVDIDAKKSGLQREHLPDDVVKANRLLCAQRFGTVNMVGRGASKILPLAPGVIDSGPPENAEGH